MTQLHPSRSASRFNVDLFEPGASELELVLWSMRDEWLGAAREGTMVESGAQDLLVQQEARKASSWSWKSRRPSRRRPSASNVTPSSQDRSIMTALSPGPPSCFDPS